MHVTIYGLYDTRKPDEIRYVGQTWHPQARLSQHRSGKDTASKDWVSVTVKSGGSVGFRVLEEAKPIEANRAEHAWRRKLPGIINPAKGEGPKKRALPSLIIPSIREVRILYAIWALKLYCGNQTRAAASLGISRIAMRWYLNIYESSDYKKSKKQQHYCFRICALKNAFSADMPDLPDMPDTPPPPPPPPPPTPVVKPAKIPIQIPIMYCILAKHAKMMDKKDQKRGKLLIKYGQLTINSEIAQCLPRCNAVPMA